jgi:hypothetical protein
MKYTCSVCGTISDRQQCPEHEPKSPSDHWSRNRDRRAQANFRVAVLLRDSFDKDDPSAYDPKSGITLCGDCDKKMDPYAR